MNAHLDLRVLASFLVLAEELHFTRAARRLHISQPPLSLQIQQLEAQVGARLFDRTNRSVRLTAAGEALRVEADKLFALEQHARQRVARVGRGEDGGYIALGCSAVASLDFVPQLLRRFSMAAPGVLYSVKELDSDAQVSALLRNELDVALVRPPVVDARLDACCLLNEPQILAIPSGHRLTGVNHVHVSQLAGEMWVAFERRTGRYAHDLMMRWLSEHDVVPAGLYNVLRHNAMMAVVSAGLGIALVPSSAGSRPINGVVFKRMRGTLPPPIELWIASRKQTSNPLVRRFVAQAVALGVAFAAPSAVSTGTT